ncbi:hypothetical protein LEN26_021043 [Aphanomyces euteiches]|nr:hypothetical protein LEN26_021043 [Aphanomyces euteiches]
MAPRREYSDDLKQVIIRHHLECKSYAKIAEIVLIPRSSVQYIVEKFKTLGMFSNVPRPGRPRLTTESLDRVIIREAKKDRRARAETIADGLDVYYDTQVSPETVRRQIRETGMNGRATIKKPYLSKANKKRRLDFAREYHLLPASYWEKVVFTDESPFNLHGSSGRIYVWRKPGEKYLDQCLAPTFKSGRDSVMMGKSILKVKLGLDEHFIFQQDNAPIHKARIIDSFFDDNAIETLPHPPQSPDLNPIEHLWELIGRKLSKKPANSIQNLKTKIEAIWNQIPVEYVQKLIMTMPKRLDMVIANRGGHTKY